MENVTDSKKNTVQKYVDIAIQSLKDQISLIDDELNEMSKSFEKLYQEKNNYLRSIEVIKELARINDNKVSKHLKSSVNSSFTTSPKTKNFAENDIWW
jgi:hypothetical protein